MPIDTPQLSLPTYSITRREDLSLQFHPPVGSLELANALSLKYPTAGSLMEQILLAQVEHIRSESQSGEFFSNSAKSQSPASHADLASSPFLTASSALTAAPTTSNGSSNSGSPTTIWNVTNGLPEQPKRRKAAYSVEKRRKVARVRKIGACEQHRRKKIEVRKCCQNCLEASLKAYTIKCTCPLNSVSRQQIQGFDKIPTQSAVTSVDNFSISTSPFTNDIAPDTSYQRVPSRSFEGDIPVTYDLGFPDPAFPHPDEFRLPPHYEYGYWDSATLSPTPNAYRITETLELATFDTSPYATSRPQNTFNAADEPLWRFQDT